MTTKATKEDRVQKVMVVVEACLRDIANEHAKPFTMAPAMIAFLADLQRALIRVGHARLLAFIGRKDKSDG
jgi:hypothetical protein